ncbi:MAG: hypothetical protein QM564_12925 [Bergeyella sp.]
MQTFYKIFLVLFILFIGFSLYSINWKLGFMHEENSKFLLSLTAGIIGLILVLVLSTWSKLAKK